MKRTGNLAGIRSEEARAFLLDLVNLSESQAATTVFAQRFGFRFLREAVPWHLLWHQAVNTREDYEQLSEDELLRSYWLLPLRDDLRRIWEAEALTTRQWGIFKICERFLLRGERNLVQGPMTEHIDYFFRGIQAPTACEQALSYLLNSAGLARFCANPGCVRPYFLARRGSQRFCTEECAKPAKKLAKKRWWDAHGRDWRQQRKKHARR